MVNKSYFILDYLIIQKKKKLLYFNYTWIWNS